jgi:hypothetical protein
VRAVKRGRRFSGSPASSCGATAERRAVSVSGSFCLALTLSFALFGCGTKQTLEQAIQCDAFKRGPDGAWSASKDVSLDYVRDGTQYQLNFSKGVVVRGKVAAEEPRLVSALDAKCAAKQ